MTPIQKSGDRPAPQDERVARRAFLERMGVAALAGRGATLPALAETGVSSGTDFPAKSPAVPIPQVADPTDWTLAQGIQAVRERTITAADWAEACLRRIRRYDGVLQAFNTVPEAEVLQAARALDAAPRRGLLHGAPLAIKDNYATRGLKTTANSLIFREWIPDFDATTVTRLRGAGG
ncbi:MAG: amidase family protein, partial [Gemmatimonadota bacterium]|nr:amidase family protein [Gemmatimonadota bacterium]